MTLSDFRPISLVSCQYKIIAKLLAQRLKLTLPDIISECQSAFVSGRQILDGVLVANEVVSWAKYNKKSLLVFKIDFAKAYDCINWNFLDSILQQMLFGEKWRGWIRSCISSPMVSILLNGSPTAEFSMERGLKQGDPLSIIAVEAINAMMQEAKDKSIFKPFKVGKKDLEISHLQFADDAVFFGEWSTSNASNLLRLLKNFEAASGLKINLRKSRLIGVGVLPAEVQRVAIRLHCQAEC